MVLSSEKKIIRAYLFIKTAIDLWNIQIARAR